MTGKSLDQNSGDLRPLNGKANTAFKLDRSACLVRGQRADELTDRRQESQSWREPCDSTGLAPASGSSGSDQPDSVRARASLRPVRTAIENLVSLQTKDAHEVQQIGPACAGFRGQPAWPPAAACSACADAHRRFCLCDQCHGRGSQQLRRNRRFRDQLGIRPHAPDSHFALSFRRPQSRGRGGFKRRRQPLRGQPGRQHHRSVHHRQ